jgi:stress-induced morphogen
MKQSETILMPKNAKKFYCEKCHFTCSKESNWIKHTMTLKHNNETNETNLEQKKNIKCQKKYECEFCENTFNSRTTLWRHKKICSIIQKEETATNNTISTTDIDIDKELLMKMLLKNQDIMEGILFKNSDVMNKMLEVMPQIGNTTNTNSHNTTNNQFNINMFLNEHCKNAMNLTDFIESLPITNKTYDDTIENGLTKTITNMMVNGLKELDILDRPIHCTDTKRKTLYVKEADIWEKDKELNKLLEAIQQIASKQRMLINKWQEANEGWETEENIQTKLTTLIFNVMTDIENNEKETKKIISAIGNKVYIDEEIKNNYL